jgi:hypothetical protein
MIGAVLGRHQDCRKCIAIVAAEIHLADHRRRQRQRQFAYVNFLKNGDNTVTKGLKIGWPEFFGDDGTLKSSITVNGTVTDCKTDSTGCYNVFKAFIQADAAAKKHVAEDGVTLWKTFRKDRELEQATARINICAAAIGSREGRCRSQGADFVVH